MDCLSTALQHQLSVIPAFSQMSVANSYAQYPHTIRFDPCGDRRLEGQHYPLQPLEKLFQTYMRVGFCPRWLTRQAMGMETTELTIPALASLHSPILLPTNASPGAVHHTPATKNTRSVKLASLPAANATYVGFSQVLRSPGSPTATTPQMTGRYSGRIQGDMTAIIAASSAP